MANPGKHTILALLAAAGFAACVVQQQPQPTAGGGAGASSADDCGNACAHYLTCKGIDDQTQWAQCTNECQANTEIDPAIIAEYPQYDCATAIQLVEGEAGGGTAAGGGGTCEADCTSCVWDGSSCYSNSMAAMGTVIECEACCCAPGGPAPRWD